MFLCRFDQLRIKRERNLSGRGRQKQKSQKYDESLGYLLFQAEVATVNGNVTCTVMSQSIKLSKWFPPMLVSSILWYHFL